MCENLVLNVNQIIEYSEHFILKYLKKNGCSLNSLILGLLMGIFYTIDSESGGMIVSKETHAIMVLKFYIPVFSHLSNTGNISTACSRSINDKVHGINEDNIIFIINTIYDIALEKYSKYRKKKNKKCILS